MIENLVVFVLGALVAILLVLVAAPVILRRTARLAEHRVRDTSPLTMGEIRAENDMIRAEHAIHLRKVEVRLDEAKRLAAERQIALGRRDAELAEVALELEARQQIVDELEERVEDLTGTILGLEKQVAEQSVALKEKQQAIAAANDGLINRSRELSDSSTLADSRKAEIAALSLQLEAAQGRIGELRAALATKSVESEGHASEVDELTGILKARDKAAKALRKRVERRRELSLARRRRAVELTQLLEAQRDRVAEKTSALSAAELKRMKLEDDLRVGVEERSQLKSRIADLEAKLEYSTREIERLKATGEAARDKGKALGPESQEKLRENISDLAARITRLAARSGDDEIRTMIEAAPTMVEAVDGVAAHGREANGGEANGSVRPAGGSTRKSGRAAAKRVPLAKRIKEVDLAPGE